MIAIVDYGMGNLRSVQKALELVKLDSIVTSERNILKESDAIILPGVGAFPDAMDNLRSKGLDKALVEEINKGKPLLGICLGMQLLFDRSEEVKETEGLAIFKGRIKRLEGNVKIPHMGWNSLIKDKEHKILNGIDEGSYTYFVHSYYASVEDKSDLVAHCSYGKAVAAVVSKDNVIGIQFHPEKSGDIGIQILKNFGELIK